MLAIAMVASAVFFAACGSDEAGDEGAGSAETTATTAPPADGAVDESPSGLAAAIAGDASWGWESLTDRATASPDDPELPRMRHAFVVDDEVWVTGATDPPIGEPTAPVTAVIDSEERSFELIDTPGFGRAVVHDGVMWGFAESDGTISTFTSTDGPSEPVPVPEVVAALEATTTASPYVTFVSLTDGRLFLQAHRTLFELDVDDPGAVVGSVDIGAAFGQFDEFEPVHTAVAGEAVLFDWFGAGEVFVASADGTDPIPVEATGPQAETLGSASQVVWHRGSDLVVADPATGSIEMTALSGSPTQPPSNAVRWDDTAIVRIGEENNPALHIAGTPGGVIAASAKRDEVVLVDMATGSKVAVGHLFGDVTNFRPLIVGDEVWMWTHDGKGIQILSFGPPSSPSESPGKGDDTDDATESGDGGDEPLADDPEYRSGRQQGRWAAEADLEDGWPADNDPDDYDPSASDEFRAGYVDGYDETYAEGLVGGGSGDRDAPVEEPPTDDCAPGQSLAECYG